MEDAVCCDRELIVAIFAVENLCGVREPDNRPMAAGAFGRIRPAKTLQKFPAKIVIGESGAKFNNGHRRFLRG
jgi:hypothetical protein